MRIILFGQYLSAYEVVADIPEVIDYSKLSMEERAEILPVPTDDYQSEYDAYCQRMGYTEEKMKSIRYKMTVYDEFLEEYSCRKYYHNIQNQQIELANDKCKVTSAR